VRLLGGGLRYEAYLAWHDDLRTLVVVKLVRPELVTDAGALDGLRREVQAVRGLAHPMLPRGFGAELEGDCPHLVLEFVEGPRLSTLIRRYAVSIEQVLPLALNLCAVLHYLGRERIVHLDVKPRNIIMGQEPQLIDLSIARRLDELGELTGPVGTDAYMAPEQCDPTLFGDLGPAADMWGLGATLHEALTGQRAFPDDGARFPQLRNDPWPLPRRVPEPLAAAVNACLERRPEDRATAQELARTLEPLVDALPAPRLGRFRPSPKRRHDHQEVQWT
jgi:serine/threonine-protein kinase